MLSGEWSEEQALEALVRATERFAKRQRTWFRAESAATWVDPRNDTDLIVDRVRRFFVPRAPAL